MKTYYIAIIIASIFVCSATSVYAQGDPAEEIKQMMDEIDDMMTELEQKFAKIALEPEELAGIFRQLRTAAETGKSENLPEAIREYLTNNIDVLAELINPEATKDEIKDIKKMLRREMQVEDGLDQVMKKYPQVLKNLLLREDLLKKSLEKHIKIENNLKSIFDSAEKEMIQTEDKLKELIKLATKLQKKMNSDAKDKEKQDEKDEGEQKEDKPENPNSKENPDPADEKYTPESSKDADGSKSRTDPFAWGNPLPDKDEKDAREAKDGKRPKNYDEESDFYFKELAKEAKRLRDLKKDSADDPDSTPDKPESEDNPESDNK